MVFGRTQNNLPSRFIASVPEELMERLPKEKKEPAAWSSGVRSGGFRAAESYSASRGRGGASYGTGRPYSPPAPRSAPRAPEKAASPLKLSAGDTVEHTAFGRGTVLSLRPMGPDCILEIAFEREGTKKLMLSSAGKFMKKL